MEPKALLLMAKLLASASSHIVGEFKCNFFLPRCFPFFLEGLDPKYCSLGNESCLEEVSWHTLRLLRIIASVHPCSNTELGDSVILDSILSLLQEPMIGEKVLRELLSFLNILVGASMRACYRAKKVVTLNLLHNLAAKKMMSLFDLIVELFITLYEMDLPYDDSIMRYTLTEASEHGRLIGTILNEVITIMISIVQKDAQDPIYRDTESVADNPPMEFLARTLDKLERSLRIVSNLQVFLDTKLIILDLLTDLFKKPRLLSNRYLSAIDVVVLLFRGSASCWKSYSPDPLDAEFVDLSCRLVKDFHSLADNKVFDNRDQNSLHYLAGSDELSTIQDVISSNSSSFTGSSLSKTNSFPQKVISNKYAVDSKRDHYLSKLCNLLHHIVQDSQYVASISSHWESHSIETTSKKLVYLHLLSSIVGWDKLRHFVQQCSELPGQILILLAENRFHMKRIPGMEKKCIELLGALTETVSFAGSSSDLSQYLIKVITSKPDGLADRGFDFARLASEYMRDNISESALLRSSRMDSIRISLTSEVLCHFDMHYAAMSALIALARADRSVRRKLVASCTEIIQSLFYFAPVDPINHRPVLHLIHTMVEFMSKLDMDAEEAIVGAIMRSLSSPLRYHQAQACDLIHAIGQEAPGLIYRGLSRLEVENELVEIFRRAPVDNCPQLLVSALKACSVLVHNPNVKPTWLPLPWLYHWSVYQPSLQHRMLLSVNGLALIINVLKCVDVAYRLPVFTHTLSVASSLMYACVDDVLRAVQKSDEASIQALKNMLVASILPWLPIAMDFITLGKKRKKLRDKSNAAVPASQTPLNAATSVSVNQQMRALERLQVEAGQHEAFVVRVITPEAVDTIIAVGSPPSQSYASQAVELLTEKTIEALYAFLCTDELIPLATYLTYVRLFEQSPLIASVSYFMTENKHNMRILRRGVDFIRYFADNKMNLSIIAMHAPAALMSAVNALKNTLEVQISFCKIIIIVAEMGDDFALENFIHFRAHLALIEMVRAYHAQLSILATQAIHALSANDINIISMARNSGLVDALVSLLDAMPKSIPAQVEALYTLIWIDTLVPELVSTSPEKTAIFAAMRRARKNIAFVAKKSPAGEGMGADRLQALLDHPVLKNSACVLS
jgi:hypothetical protein